MSTEVPTTRDILARHMQRGMEPLSLARRYADDLLADLAKAGKTIGDTATADPVVDLNRMADGREQYLRGKARDPRTATDLDALSRDDLSLWVEVQTWRQAARLAGGDRELLYSMPSWCWSDEMVKALREPGRSS